MTDASLSSQSSVHTHTKITPSNTDRRLVPPTKALQSLSSTSTKWLWASSELHSWQNTGLLYPRFRLQTHKAWIPLLGTSVSSCMFTLNRLSGYKTVLLTIFINKTGTWYSLELYLVSSKVFVSIVVLHIGPQQLALSAIVPRHSTVKQVVLGTVFNTVWPQLPCGKRRRGQVRHLDVNHTASLRCTAKELLLASFVV